MITFYTIAYNEEVMLPQFIKHYRTRFPGCRIVVYNNMSDDRTKDIAFEFGCEVIDYDTGGKLSDIKYLEIKNNCWKDATTDWVWVGDVDEHCLFTQADLINEDAAGANILRFEGYNMVAMRPTLDVTQIEYGVRAPSYDKSYCFNRIQIDSVNYNPGAHTCKPITVMGAYEVKYSEQKYKCLHYKYLNLEFMIKRHAIFASRLSPENIAKGYGFHYRYPAAKIRKEFADAQRNAIKII